MMMIWNKEISNKYVIIIFADDLRIKISTCSSFKQCFQKELKGVCSNFKQKIIYGFLALRKF
jgi:hypothetical protein